MESPSQQLAAKIIDRLISEKLVSPEDAKSVQSKFADGTFTAEDWRFLIENKIERERRES